MFILGFQTTSVFRDYHNGADSKTPTIWVQSFTPASSSFQQNFSFRWQRQPHSNKAREWMVSKLMPGASPLYASGGNDNVNGNESSKNPSATAVYSVFSKSPNKVFRELTKGEDGLLRLEDIYSSTNDGDEGRWDELDEIIQDGDLSVQEVKALYNSAMINDGEGLDSEGFKRFYKSIDELFDDDDDDDEGDDESLDVVDNPKTDSEMRNVNQDLVSYLEEVQQQECDSEGVQIGKRRPWGLDCTDKERNNISELINLVTEDENSNILAGRSNNNGLPMSAKDLVKYLLGTWDLKYTSSRTMIINKSLSGLGRSTSEMARNLGLQMKLSGNYYFGKAEFVETFGSSGDEEDDGGVVMLEAKVTGEWLLETGTRLLKTGRPSVSLRVEVETIAYGPTTSPAEQWDSLSPIKLVDILYLDENLLVLRGNFNVDAIFVYTR